MKAWSKEVDLESTQAANTATNRSYQQAVAQVGKAAGIVTLGAFIGSGLEYVTRTLMARHLGPDGFGLLNLGYSVVLFGATLSLLGMQSGLARFIAFYQGRDDDGRTRETILSAFKLCLPLMLILSVGLLLLAGLLSDAFFDKPELEPVLRLFAIGLPLIALSQLLMGMLRGFKEMTGFTLSRDLGMSGIRLGAFVLLVVAGLGIQSAVLAFVLSYAGVVAMALYFLWRRFPLRRITGHRVAIRELFSYSWPLVVSDVMREMERRTEVLFLGYFVASGEIGFYSAAFLIGRILTLPLNGFNSILMPVASELYARQNRHDVRRLYRSVARWLFYITTPILMALVFFAEPVSVLLFGAEYRQAAPVLRILAWGYFAVFATGSWEQILLAMGKTKVLLGLKGIWVGSNLLLDIVLIPRRGIVGAATAAALPLILTSLLGVATIYHYDRLQPFGSFQLRHLSISAAIVGSAYFLTQGLPSSSALLLVLIALAVGLSYGGALGLIGLTEDDHLLLSLVRDRLKRIAVGIRGSLAREDTR